MDSHKAYLQYYQAQRGGQLPVFRGGLQGGEGIGDILRGIFRFLAPVALKGITAFAGHTLDAHQKGATLKDAAKSALNPTLNSVVSTIGDQVRGMQSGSGLKRRIHEKQLNAIKHARPTIFLNKAESLAAAAASMAPGYHSTKKRKHHEHGYKSQGKVKRLSNGRFASTANHLNF